MPRPVLDGRVVERRPSLTERELRLYAEAGLVRADAEVWKSAGIEPYQAQGYRSAGLALDNAVWCWEAGFGGTETAGMDRATLRSQVYATIRRLARLEEGWPPRVWWGRSRLMISPSSGARGHGAASRRLRQLQPAAGRRHRPGHR